MPRFNAKIDANQKEIVEQARGLGLLVQHTHAAGQGVPDLIIADPRTNRMAWCEVKSKNGKLNDAQQQFFAEWWTLAFIARSIDDVVLYFGLGAD